MLIFENHKEKILINEILTYRIPDNGLVLALEVFIIKTDNIVKKEMLIQTLSDYKITETEIQGIYQER